MGVLILIVLVVVLAAVAAWAGRGPNPPGGSAGNSTPGGWAVGG